MAKKRRNPDSKAQRASGNAGGAPTAATAVAAAGPGGFPGEVVRGDWTAILLCLAVFLAPALGVPHEEMLQDTLKSIVVCFLALAAGLLFFWNQRARSEPLRWHAIVWLPLLLSAYALGSMAWSHTYLAAVEAIRWFIFAVLLWLGLNTFSRERMPLLAWAVHGGALVAALWAALQFWVNFRYFPQGPNPASTFVNRNFFAEFAACTLPFGALLLAQARTRKMVCALAISNGFLIVTILMTGTRSAMTAMWLQTLLVLPLIAWHSRKRLAFGQWDAMRWVLAVGLLLITVLTLGAIPSDNASLAAEQRGRNALERGFKRTASIAPGDESLGIRKVMWKATTRMIAGRPLSGVGAGAWENDIPLYQEAGSQLETDYYAHNEFLQLLAEYGLVGWVFLLLLSAYLLVTAWRTLRPASEAARDEAPVRAVLLCSLLALFVVSNIGFPWRMASTGALFAVCLAGLAASDARLGLRGRLAAMRLHWKPAFSQAGIAASVACLALAVYITQRAAETERKIVHATRLALTITASGDPASPRWDKRKAELLQLIREGIAINPHYRKITPIVADELARWGDWTNATWIWESVLSSRPYVVAIMTNIARGYASTGHPDRALEYLARAKKIQPDAPAVRSLEVILLSRTGKEAQALELARASIRDKAVDYDLLNATFHLAVRNNDFPLALKALEMRMARWPESRTLGYLQLGGLYFFQLKEPQKALEAYRSALETMPPDSRAALQPQVPAQVWAQLTATGSIPATTTQMSVISK